MLVVTVPTPGMSEPGEFEASAETASELAVASAEQDPTRGSGPEGGPGPREDSGRRHGSGAIAVLLATAAVVAAIVGARSAMISSTASDQWQSALRTEVKRSAAAMEDIRALYQTELPQALQILRAQLLEEADRAAAASATGAARLALQVDADTQAELVKLLESDPNYGLGPAYILPSGGFDLAKSLADLRAKYPALLALDPDAMETAGDAYAHKANLITLALLPTSIGALLGVLGQPLRRRRGQLLALGWVAVAIGTLFALGVEALV